MSAFKLEGTLMVANPTQVISEKFSKREFVIETKDQYPQLVMFQATQDKCGLLDAFQAGEQVEVSFNLRGREWISPAGQTKYFNTLEAFRIDKVGSSPVTSNTPPQPVETNDALPF
jgi:hypothetical protein